MAFFENKIVQIIIACAIPFISSAILGYGAEQNMYPWYNEIKKPTWGPPDWAFAPIWFSLYLAIGFASYRVWDAGNRFTGIAKVPLILYIIQLVINGTWS